MATKTKSNVFFVPINQIKANRKNPRIIKDDKFEKLVKSIQEFPEMLEKRPLVCFTDTDDKFVVLGGNMRLKASQAAGLSELPITLADDWTEEKKAEFLIKDNVSFGEWSFVDLQEWDAELLDDWGLDLVDFEKEYLKDLPENKEDDYISDPPKNPITKLGDIYELNAHRLLCGDSLLFDNINKVRPDFLYDLIFTDPPFEIEAKKQIEACLPFSDFFIFSGCGPTYFELVKNDFIKVWFEIICKRNQPRSLPRWKGPHVLHWGNLFLSKIDKGHPPFNRNLANGLFSDNAYFPTVIGPYSKDDNDYGYGKPVKFAYDILHCCSVKNVLDPFAGAGTFLLACEMNNIINTSIELKPECCDVIVKRYIKYMTNEKKPFIIKRNNKVLSTDEINKYIENE